MRRQVRGAFPTPAGMRTSAIEGLVEAGFEPVADAFAANFDRDEEVGAAFAAYAGGRPVVDVWGGVADHTTGRPWERDTLQLIFSGTKGLTAGCVLLLMDRGRLAEDCPVAHYWPEFAACGKEEVTVGNVLTHQAGLAAVTTDLELADLLNPVAVASKLAAQAPHWSDGRLAYHGLTYGWLCDGLVRRVDGRSVGGYFADEIAKPLGLEAWIGLPPELEHRVSSLTMRDYAADPPASAYGRRVFFNPPVFVDPLPWNRPEFHTAELAGVNGVASARSIARYYACLAHGGELDGVRLCSPAAVESAAAPRTRGVDPYALEEVAFGLGFELQNSEMSLGSPADAFGHTGAGGSSHGAWPSQGVGFSYCMNEMRPEAPDRRARRVLAALAACI